MAKKSKGQLEKIVQSRPAILTEDRPLVKVWLVPTFGIPPTDPISVRIHATDSGWIGRRASEGPWVAMSRWSGKLWRLATSEESKALDGGQKIVVEGNGTAHYPHRSAEERNAIERARFADKGVSPDTSSGAPQYYVMPGVDLPPAPVGAVPVRLPPEALSDVRQGDIKRSDEKPSEVRELNGKSVEMVSGGA